MAAYVQVGETGRRVGEDHGRAKLSDRDVELMRRLSENGVCYPVLARSFGVSAETVGRICRFEIRNVVKVGYKRVEEKG